MTENGYDAFISYSHSDIGHAKWLQRRLETFRIPKDLEAEKISGRRLRVFRDQTDLAGVELQDSLRRELELSDNLIVICSPRSASSVWVNEEISYFREIGKGDNIIPFIVEGEAESDNEALECYPPGLRHAEDKHMLGANIQEIGRNKAFLKILSIIIGVRFNRLVDREKLRKRRTIGISVTAASVVAAVVIGLLAHNAVISKKNHELSYDIYLSALDAAFREGGSLEESLKSVNIDYLIASAEEGNTNAMVLLCSCYSNGYGTEPDDGMVYYWSKKGAEAGDPTCMITLANCYQFGTGTQADAEEAFRWYLNAAETGDQFGMVTVGYAYEGGIGTDEDPKSAFEWYKKAADAGYEEGMEQVARCYRDGVGCAQDREEAFAWNIKLAESGNVDAMYNVGMMYQYKFGVEEDPEMAYYWYRKAAEAGDAKSAYMVGWCTENSYGTEDAALEWYRAAKELGSDEAEAEIERIQNEKRP